jgi:hypothetical protein
LTVLFMELLWASVICCPSLRAICVVRSPESNRRYFFGIVQQMTARVKKEQDF